MRKKIAFLLVLCMLVCTACGSVEEKNNVVTTESQSTTETEKAQVEEQSTTQIQEMERPITTTKREEEPTVINPTQKPTTTEKQEEEKTTTAAKPTTTQRPATQANHVHSWVSATCEKPRSCACGATDGNPRGHSYRSATCEEAETCSRCGKTQGKPLGHVLKGTASCTGCDQCSRCNRYVDGTELGHAYNDDGICTRCKGADPNHIEHLKVGEKWVVEGLWEFTVTSASKHYACNMFGDHNGPVIIVNYTYKNLGYNDVLGSGLLSIGGDFNFDIYDETGEIGETYPCTHTADAKGVKKGASCSAGQGFALNNESSKVILTVAIDAGMTNYVWLRAEIEIEIS